MNQISNPQFVPEKRRHIKAMWISPQLLMECLFQPRRINDGKLQTVVVENLPRDCEIMSCLYDDVRQSFGFLLYHHSFEAIPSGHVVPEIIATCRSELLQLAPEEIKRGREFI